jgi:Ca2+/Na+ antiporter
MGLTVTAIGTSAPDAFASFITARKDKNGGKMAISNVFGSNIFDILLALGLPILVFSGGKGLKIDLTENLISVVILFCIFFFFIFAVIFSRPQLIFKKWLAWICVGMYIGYIIYVIAEDVARESM